MTDKQIIIDGVKTSKKDFIDNFSIELTNRNIFEREQIGDKYFEIILAKEQECEELKDINAELDVDLQNARDSYVALDLMRVGEYNALVDDYNKLKQTLTEIKEIAESKSLYGATCQDMKQILNKISEVLDV